VFAQALVLLADQVNLPARVDGLCRQVQKKLSRPRGLSPVRRGVRAIASCENSPTQTDVEIAEQFPWPVAERFASLVE